MKKSGHLIVILLVVLGLTSCAGGLDRPLESVWPQEHSLPFHISLAGKWKIKQGDLAPANLYLTSVEDDRWKEISVPSNWFLQGIDYSGVIWFRRYFRADAAWKNRVVKLVFEGVDYASDVWLNGHYMGFHEGYFGPFSFFITDFIRLGADNILTVRVNSPYEEPGKVWSLKKRLIKGIFNHHDTRPGGAWSMRGQEKNTGGIWAPVYLKVSEALSVEGVKVNPEVDPESETASAIISMTVVRPVASVAGDFVFAIKLSPFNFVPEEPYEILVTETSALIPGKNELTFHIPSSRVRLWWPWDHGKPNLYRIQVGIYHGTKLLETAEDVFGFRTVACDPETMMWRINGRRMFLRGTNYISSQWLSEMTPEKYAYDVSLMKGANVNTVRVHAHIEAKNFYRKCDEMGVLVWQDFPLQWGYTDDPAFIGEAKKQSREMVDSLYNHPSIIAWCGHNEPPWDASWMKYKYKHYDPDQNKILDDELFACLKDADQTRYVHKVSSTGEHPWLGWYSGSWKDYGKPTKQPFITEFGAQALPRLSSLQKIFHRPYPWPASKTDWDLWSYHNFQHHETFDIAKVPMGKDINEFIANTQEYQARLVKYAAESYRRQKYAPVTGIFQFMFVEDWPSINWGIVDYWRNPKPGYEALKTAFQPVLPSIEWEKYVLEEGETFSAGLWVVNDLFQEFDNAGVIYAITGAQGLIEKGVIKVDIKPDSAQKLTSITRDGLPEGSYEFLAVVNDSDGKCMGQNSFQFFVRQK